MTSPSPSHPPPEAAAAFDRRRWSRRVLERLRRRVVGPLFTRLGYDVLPAAPEWLHRPVSPREVERLLARAAESLERDFAAAGLDGGTGLKGIVADFWALIPTAPVRQKHGGNGFNGALQLYALLRTLQPAVIIESGVFRGLTTWIARQACPDAKLYCFDPVLTGLRYRDPQATYSSADWSTFDFAGVDLSNALAFFDDHIDQARRILEARERGLTRLLFDDNTASHTIHAHGGPAYPTVDMILSDAPTEPVRWVRNGLAFTYLPDAARAEAVRGAVIRAHAFDDLHRATGYSPARLCYVALVPRTPQP